MNNLNNTALKRARSRILNIAKYLIGWPVSIISLVFILDIIYSNKTTLYNLATVNFSLLTLSILSFFIYFILRSLLWHEIIKEKGNKFSFKTTTYFWEISEIKRYTPGNIWSFLSRANLFTKDNISNKDLFSSLVKEMLLIVLACATLSIFYIFSFKNDGLISDLIIIFIIAFVLSYIFAKKVNSFIPQVKMFNIIKELILPGESYYINFKLLLLATAAFLMFGIATYFSAISIFTLSLKNIDYLISLFVFSLLIGYLSIITPMGLGVREGAMTFGLLRFLSLSAAGIVSIYSRIVFIVSEILFLALTFAWIKSKNRFIKRAEDYISLHKHEILLVIFVSVYILYFTFASFLRYDNFYTGRFDLGNMDQAVWNTIHGRIFQITDPNGTNIMSRLAFHADFILILISPLYLIWSNPEMLLLLQSVILGLGAIFIFLISMHIIKNKNYSLAFSVLYLLNPSMQYTNLFDFHPVTLATTFLLAAFYFYLKRKYILLLLFGFLAGLTKEDVWAVVSVFGVAILVRDLLENNFRFKNIGKKRAGEILLGFIIFVFSNLIFYLLIWKIIPLVKGGNHFALAYYSDFGNSASSVTLNILFSPLKTLQIALEPQKLYYLMQLFFPLGFLSILTPLILIFASPDLLINLLSSNPQLHEIYYQYTSNITPFIFISAIYSIRLIKIKFIKLSNGLIISYLFFCTIIAAYILGPLPGALNPNIDMFTKQLPNRSIIDKFISNIPVKYSIAATNNLGSHLSRRQDIYTIPVGINKADVILFLLNDPFAQPSLAAQKNMAKKMEDDKNYIQIYKNGDFIAFEKKNLYTKPNPKKGQAKLFPDSIEALSDREYLSGNITVESTVSSNFNFKTNIVSYISDGLKEYALMDIPNTPMPSGGYPVVIVDHGYIVPNQYNTVGSYSEITNYFASQGFLVLKPDYRGNGNSEDNNEALMRFAYPIDVLNLLASTSNIPFANSNQVFLWSHSMGGEVTLEVLEVAASHPEIEKKIKAAVFWAPVTDPVKWFTANHLTLLPEYQLKPFPYTQTFQIMGTPEQNPTLWNTVSPLNYLKYINVPILIQHGTLDNTVPYSWSVNLYNSLISLHKNAQIVLYSGSDHNLSNNTNAALSEDLSFYLSNFHP